MTHGRVERTASELLRATLPLVADLARQLPESERYRRLLEALRSLMPADAVALLRNEGSSLVPLAVDGLSADTLGRRFLVHEHPRFEVLLASSSPVRFDADCSLPDPYDGLVEHIEGHLPVHDCMGVALRVEDRVWGLLTVDALAHERFAEGDLELLEAFASVASATVHAAQRIEDLTAHAEQERKRAESYRAAGRPARHLIGRSAAHRALLEEIALVGSSELGVLVVGETGVGKELVTQAIHAASKRANRPLVSLNCAALPDALVESELFGHVKGAFSGAVAARQGKFELAHGGTLFLDEVGELPLSVQAKLLRVLQEGQLQRLGSDREHHVDVRLIAATNRDLAEEVRTGRFRADLYHRLSAYPLRVPALRARGRDVLLLAGSFLEENRARLGVRNLRIDEDTQAALLAYDWPGNVRELEHVIARAALHALGRHRGRPTTLTIDVQDLGTALDASPRALTADTPSPPERLRSSVTTLRAAVDDFERHTIEARLEECGGNWAAAARSLGVDRANLLRLARRLGIRSA